jgi:intraflagellar transport protein 140
VESGGASVHDFGKSGRRPVALAWDSGEPHLLAVQTEPLPAPPAPADGDAPPPPNSAAAADGGDAAAAPESAGGPGAAAPAAAEVALLFASPEAGVLLQDFEPLPAGGAGLLGVAAPHLLLRRAIPGGGLMRAMMQSFTAMQDADEGVRRALLDFARHTAAGDTESAFRAVRAVQSPGLWETMARVAIKSRRLDVAELCIGHVENARAARAAREGRALPELDARMAAVAVHLGASSPLLQLRSRPCRCAAHARRSAGAPRSPARAAAVVFLCVVSAC